MNRSNQALSEPLRASRAAASGFRLAATVQPGRRAPRSLNLGLGR